MDPSAERLDEIAGEVEVQQRYTGLDEAMRGEQGRLTGVIVASPPIHHVEQALAALEAGTPVLLEKPVSPDLASARRLADAVKSTGAPLLLGYTWRWWPPLADVRRMLAEDAIGQLRYVRFVMSAHLADWHPWERYQDFFMASRAQGGGALLDESHWVDLALWLFGPPREVVAQVDKISDLEIDSDDNVDMMLSYDGGLRVSLHLDLYGRPHEKSIRFTGERGTLQWTAEPNRLAVSHDSAGTWSETLYDCDRNEMFVAVAREFLAVVAGATPSCTIIDGVAALRVLEAARHSSAEGRTVELAEMVG